MIQFRSISFLASLLLPALFLLPLDSSAQNPGEAEKPNPKISLLQTTHDFGRIFSGEKVIHIFKFRNNGNAPLVIKKVRQSCGCTATVLSATTLEPGTGGELQSTFDSTGFSGNVFKTIYLYSNDPTSPVSQLHLRGVVQREISTKPNRIRLDDVIPEKTFSTEVKLTHHGMKEISFGPLRTTTEEIKAKISSSGLDPGGSAIVTITIIPQRGKKRLGGFVIVPVNGSHMSEIRIPVYANISSLPSPTSSTEP